VQTITMPVATASVAAVLARSAEAGNLDRLEADLKHARAVLKRRPESFCQEETRELLDALAGELSVSVQNSRESGQAQWDTGTFPTYLLKHVASRGSVRGFKPGLSGLVSFRYRAATVRERTTY
jgi:hypothetical protein